MTRLFAFLFALSLVLGASLAAQDDGPVARPRRSTNGPWFGLTLPTVPPAVANYLPYRVAGNLLFLAGQGPRGADGSFMTGKVGGEVSVEEGHKRARIIGLQLLSAMKMALGSLDRVDTVLKMLCMVNAVPDFKDHPKVADGMSNLFVEVFGENGRHARSAVGMGSLPNQISVEIEGVISIKA